MTPAVGRQCHRRRTAAAPGRGAHPWGGAGSGGWWGAGYPAGAVQGRQVRGL